MSLSTAQNYDDEGICPVCGHELDSWPKQSSRGLYYEWSCSNPDCQYAGDSAPPQVDFGSGYD